MIVNGLATWIPALLIALSGVLKLTGNPQIVDGMKTLGVKRVLPAHGDPFDDLPGRVDQIIQLPLPDEFARRRLVRLFGANLDIGHSQVLGENIPDCVRLLGKSIWNLHVEDIPGRKHYHLIPGEGTLDWSTFKSALERVGYDRFLTVELYTHTADPQLAAERSSAFLTKHFGPRG